MFLFEDIGLRPIEKRDLEEIRLLRNSQSTWIHLTSVELINEAQQLQWYENVCRDKDIEYYSVVKIKYEFPVQYEKEFLGIIRVKDIDLTNRSAMIGLDIKPGFRRQGVGTRAFTASLEYFFQHRNFHRLYLCVLENNEFAQKLYKNVGFSLEGVMKEAIWRSGRWNDYLVFSLLEDHYREIEK